MKLFKRLLIIKLIVLCSLMNAAVPSDLYFYITISKPDLSKMDGKVVNQFENNISSKQVHTDTCAISLNLDDIKARGFDVTTKDIIVKNTNNTEVYQPQLCDTNADGKADQLVFYTKLSYGELLRAFQLVFNAGNQAISTTASVQINEKFPYSVTWLKPASDIKVEKKWADIIAGSIIETYPNPRDLEIFGRYGWTYTNGFFINPLFELEKITGNKAYTEYAKRWVDLFVSAEGTMDTIKYKKNKMELDQILAARAPLYLYQQTKEDKYKIVSESFIAQLEKHPRTSDGGYWHKQVYEWQMWLDGIYMADVFKMQYAAMFDKPKITDDAIHQITLIYKHTHDPKTGLMFHGWDEHKNKVWADQTTGCSPEVWARGLGWYMMALVDVLDYIPANHPQRDSVLQILNSLSVNLAKYQNTEGLWYQVVDKGDRPDNWVETSATAMYAYAYAKGAKKGYLPKEYFEKAAKAFEGMRKSYLFFDDSGKLHMLGTVKVGTLNFKFSDGSYKYYINVDRRIDDFKGIGALLYLAIELSN